MPRPVLAAAIALAAAAIAVAACNDDRSRHPTAPESPAAPVAEVAAAGGTGGVSTVCLAYQARASVAREKLAEATKRKAGMVERVTLTKRVEKLDAMAGDACR